MKKHTKSVRLNELMFEQVTTMNKAEISAFRDVLASTLPSYIDEAAKRARELTSTTEQQKHDTNNKA